jgi:KUP system potassium uptake protein
MAPTQHISNDIHPLEEEGGGVYARKDPFHEKLTQIRSAVTEKEGDGDVNDVERATLDPRDLRHKQEFKGWTIIWLAFQSTGVIYGDIGTSPLYVYSATFSSPPSYDDLVGSLSLIIWALTIMVTVKYIFIVLNADDEGEGGTFALFSLISRYAHLVDRHPREEAMTKIERHKTGDMPRVNNAIRSVIENNSFIKWFFKVIGVFGVALLIADGILTPAQSILGAIQGITVVNPNITTPTVVGVSCAILVLVYAVQPFGTEKLALTFAPIVVVWLLFNLTFGIYNLAKFDPSVFKAFSPYLAGNFLVRNGRDGWVMIGGILLAFTGCEALFADLGAFSKRSIQLSWMCFAYPCLLIAYIGQAAYISVNPAAFANPFFLTVPPGMLWPGLIVAILACIVASQAVITASFQLLSQIMKLSYFPQIELIHVSKKYHHQVYVPFANWLMMIGAVVVTAVYNNTTKLGEAYGTCVILVTFLTTFMVAVVALIVWRISIFIVIPVFIVFALWDGLFLSSALAKVPDGAWFTLAIAIILCTIFVLWRFGKEEQWKSEAVDNIPLSRALLLSQDGEEKHDLRLHDAFGGSQVQPLKGLGIFFDKAGKSSAAPIVFLHFLKKFSASTEVTVFFHLRPLGVPSVPPDDQFTVSRCFAMGSDDIKIPLPNCYRMIVRHGYTDEIVSPNLGLLVANQLRKYLIAEEGANNPDSITKKTDDRSDSGSEASRSPITDLQRAYDNQVLYIVGKEQLRLRPGTNIFRFIFLSWYLWIRENTRSKVQRLNVETERLVEVGFIKDI